MEATYITAQELRAKFEELYPFVSLEMDDIALECWILGCKASTSASKVASYLLDYILAEGLWGVQQ